jgi:hypothetical protein
MKLNAGNKNCCLSPFLIKIRQIALMKMLKFEEPALAMFVGFNRSSGDGKNYKPSPL